MRVARCIFFFSPASRRTDGRPRTTRSCISSKCRDSQVHPSASACEGGPVGGGSDWSRVAFFDISMVRNPRMTASLRPLCCTGESTGLTSLGFNWHWQMMAAGELPPTNGSSRGTAEGTPHAGSKRASPMWFRACSRQGRPASATLLQAASAVQPPNLRTSPHHRPLSQPTPQVRSTTYSMTPTHRRAFPIPSSKPGWKRPPVN